MLTAAWASHSPRCRLHKEHTPEKHEKWHYWWLALQHHLQAVGMQPVKLGNTSNLPVRTTSWTSPPTTTTTHTYQ
jgi:hypothetical protein